jgi:hypothetical protein
MPKPKENVIICDDIPTEFKPSNDRCLFPLIFTEYSPGTSLVDENISKYYVVPCILSSASSRVFLLLSLELAIVLESSFGCYAFYLLFLSRLYCHVCGHKQGIRTILLDSDCVIKITLSFPYDDS